jgi:hypothetical protein
MRIRKKKKPYIFYPKKKRSNLGQVKIEGETYDAARVPMADGRRGTAIQAQRFNVGDKVEVFVKRLDRFEPYIIVSVEKERGREFVLWRYYYGEMGSWVRDFFEDGAKPGIREGK